MKTILALLTLFSTIALPAFGELTNADLNQMRLIVQEEIRPIKADIVTLKTDLAVVKLEVANLKEKVADLKDTVNNDFGTIQKNFGRQNNIIIACIGIPLAIFAIALSTRDSAIT